MRIQQLTTLIWTTVLSFFALLLTESALAADAPTATWTFSCRAENDLYRTMTANGLKCARYDTPAEAVAAAAEGAAVLILADGYPEKPTTVEAAVFDEAARKKLRLYIEYPAALPSSTLAKPRRATVERAVVASDFFGEDLKPLRIMAVNGLYFIPTVAKNPHLVAARVAGFDTAVFGLPKTTYPLLFEHRGNILVSTTKLSNFLTGRYAPQDTWRTAWSSILHWLQAGKGTVPFSSDENRDSPPAITLKWTPMVGPTFGRNEPLPADVEKLALQRGVEWFIKSKLLLDRSRLGDRWQSLQAAGGLVAFNGGRNEAPTPPPDAPVGDGSLGILEAPLSIILADGSQMQGVARRGDCNGESAMALAFGGMVFNDPKKADIAKNLLDFWYFTSDACKKERGDPKNGAYGLVAWGVDSPAWYVANYGDDNARLLMGTMAVAALLKSDHWDEPMMRCLLANLRTTGQLGFRGDRIDIPALSQQGWRPFFERKIISYSPHMEAYLWACYLWAYDRTGYEMFYQRAENALRMTMAQYTDGWRWTNGLAQEKARILLPLAWLVRVKDTPEHRRWLNQAVDGLLALQEPCGAIREELGLPGKGMYPPPGSNKAYGGNEASLIQRNGDPVCDMLYTTNFAFLGLHEAAAATGDVRIRQAEDKLAKFLCRIQVRSEAQPSLDGGWFRAFDFQRWEPWASNADAGWGAWAIESGWTQGWIASVLAMRQLDASLWGMTKQSKINKHFDKLRREMLPDEVLEPKKER